jgi:hypothetical protein
MITRDVTLSIDDLELGLPVLGETPFADDFGDFVAPSSLTAGELQGNTTVQDGYLKSKNFVSGSAGWQLTPTSAELNVSTAVNSLDIPDTTTANSFHVESDGDTYWGADIATGFAAAPASVSKAGSAKFTDVTITGGSITSTPISAIPNSTATDISLLEATHDLVFSVTDKDTVAWASGTITLSNGRTFSISAGNTGNMAARTYVYLDTGASTTVLQTTTTVSSSAGANKKLVAVAQNGSAQAQYTVYGGIGGIKLPASGTSISNNNWTYSGTWSVTDADTIAWGAGTLTTSDGGSYSVTGSNTGNMAAKTYIYFDLGTSSTAFQTTTTASTAIGDGKILIAIAQNGTAEANYLVVNDKQSNIDAAQIVAGSITANEIAANTITAGKLSVSQLSAIAADMGTLTTGVINLSSGTSYIKSGQTAYDSGTGFWLEYNSGTPRFSIGDSAGSKITWDGTTLDITGVSKVTKFFTAGEALTAGDAVFVASGSEGENITVPSGDGSASVTVSSTSTWGAQTFTTRASETGAITTPSVTISLRQLGGATGTLAVSIRATSGGQPTGADLATAATKDIASIAGSFTDYTFSFTPIALSANTTYAIVVRATSIAVQSVEIQRGSSSYSGGTSFSSSNSGSSWSDNSHDWKFTTSINFTTAGSVYKTNAAQSSEYAAFIGFVKTTTARASSAPIVISGEATGLSSLTRGSNYYLADGYGTIQTSAGTNTRKVGIAISTTSLLITNIW